MAVTITDPTDVRRILADPDHRVPEADAGSDRAVERFRAATSRFVDGRRHDERRARIEQLLAALDPAALARTATRRAGAARQTPHLIARTVPVESLAEHLGFANPDGLPALIAEIAAVYATGARSEAADDAATRAVDGAPDPDPELAVQLLVQAHLATAALIDGALRVIASEPELSTRTALVRALRHEPPVPSTRRIRPDGGIVVLGLADEQTDSRADADADADASMLAFGAGPRACPAPAHALAVAAAVVDALRSRAAR